MKKAIIENLLNDNNIEAILITSKVNRYWYTNFSCSSGYLLITKNNQFLLLDGRYKTDAQTRVKNAEIIIVDNVFIDLKNLIDKLAIKSLGFESEYMTYSFYQMYQEKLQISLKPVSVRNIRMIKTDEEIEYMRKVVTISDLAFKDVVDKFVLSMSENDVENILFQSFQKHGADKIFPRAIVVSGKRGALPHGKPTDKKIEVNELVTIDFGCVYKGYCSDITRNFAVGEIDPKLKQIYQIVQTAQRLAIEAIKPNVKASDINKICKDYINEQGYGQYFVHQTGHGVGLEVHEAPRIADYDECLLQKGMIITIEPGIYIPNLGGVRIEDDVLVTKNGCEVLSKLNTELFNIYVIKKEKGTFKWLKKNEFDEIIDRSNNFDRKWNKKHLAEKYHLNNSDNILSSWIGDTDFKCPQPVIDAVLKRAVQGIYGYSYTPEEVIDAIKNWHQRIFNLQIENEWIRVVYGTVGALFNIVQTFTNVNDNVLVQTPVYGPFAEAIKLNDRNIIKNKLIYQDNRYYIDFNDFEEKIVQYNIKVFIFCSPHNPGGIVWSEEEIKTLFAICKKHQVLIIADEVHRDLVFDNNTKFVSALSFKEHYNHLIVCSSPNKTFNFGGLKISYVVTANQNIRKSLNANFDKNRITSPNTFAPYALIAAYSECDQWMKDLNQYLALNFAYLKSFINENMNYLKVMDTKASFFAWVDFSQTKLTMQQVKQIMENEKVFLCYGDVFISDGENFMRINYGCSKIILEAILKRIKLTFDKQGF